jgi:hypothetical protein
MTRDRPGKINPVEAKHPAAAGDQQQYSWGGGGGRPGPLRARRLLRWHVSGPGHVCYDTAQVTEPPRFARPARRMSARRLRSGRAARR